MTRLLIGDDRLEHRRFQQLINDIVSLLCMAAHVLKLYKLRPSPVQTAMAWMLWQGAKARTRATNSIAASDNCHRLLKPQGTVGSQFANPMEVSIRVRSSWLPVVSAAERVPVDVVAAFSDSSSPFFHVHRFFFGDAAGFELTCQQLISLIIEYTTTCAL